MSKIVLLICWGLCAAPEAAMPHRDKDAICDPGAGAGVAAHRHCAFRHRRELTERHQHVLAVSAGVTSPTGTGKRSGLILAVSSRTCGTLSRSIGAP